MNRPLNLEEDRAPALFCRIFFALSARHVAALRFSGLLLVAVSSGWGKTGQYRFLSPVFFRNGADCFMDF